MLKKLHIVLIVSILFIGVFSIDTYAASQYDHQWTQEEVEQLLDSSSYTYNMFFTSHRDSEFINDVLYLIGSNFGYVPAERIKTEDTMGMKQTTFFPTDFRYYVQRYQYEDGAFVLKNTQVIESIADGGSGIMQVHYGVNSSNFDMYLHNGEVFFIKTLPLKEITPTVPEKTILETIMEMVPTMAEKIMETLKILVPFGVGLLALWIGLKILPMVLFKFL